MNFRKSRLSAAKYYFKCSAKWEKEPKLTEHRKKSNLMGKKYPQTEFNFDDIRRFCLNLILNFRIRLVICPFIKCNIELNGNVAIMERTYDKQEVEEVQAEAVKLIECQLSCQQHKTNNRKKNEKTTKTKRVENMCKCTELCN